MRDRHSSVTRANSIAWAMHLSLLLLLLTPALGSQMTLSQPEPTVSWSTLGPFPLGSREGPLLRPLRPDLSLDRHPSPLVDGAFVRETSVLEDEDGWVAVGDDKPPTRCIWFQDARALKHAECQIRPQVEGTQRNGGMVYSPTPALLPARDPHSHVRFSVNPLRLLPHRGRGVLTPPPKLVQFSLVVQRQHVLLR